MRTTASKLFRIPVPSMECMPRDRMMNKANDTVGDGSPSLVSSFEMLPSG